MALYPRRQDSSGYSPLAVILRALDIVYVILSAETEVFFSFA
jgi:hypothetical protein